VHTKKDKRRQKFPQEKIKQF